MPRIFDSEKLIRLEIHELETVERDGKKTRQPKTGETVSIWMKPLDVEEKTQCFGSFKKIVAGVEIEGRNQILILALEMSIKRVDNLFYDEAKTNPFKVEIADGKLSKKCISALLNCGFSGEVFAMAENLVSGYINRPLNFNGMGMDNTELVFDQVPGEVSPNI